MSDKRILLVGEACKDIFVYGDCNRLSPEAPCVIHQPTRTEVNDGMAANVRANLLSLSPGTKVDFFHQTQEIYKIRHIDDASGQHLLRVDDGDDAFEPDFWAKVIDGMAACVEGYKAIVISDYGKGLLSTKMMAGLAAIGRELGIPSFLDTKAILGDWSRDFDFVKINDKEYRHQLANGLSNPWTKCHNLIVTRGKEGSFLYQSDDSGLIAHHALAVSRGVFSVAGAGDSYHAALVLNYLETGNIYGAMAYANRAAAVAVSRRGVVAVTSQEIESI